MDDVEGDAIEEVLHTVAVQDYGKRPHAPVVINCEMLEQGERRRLPLLRAVFDKKRRMPLEALSPKDSPS